MILVDFARGCGGADRVTALTEAEGSKHKARPQWRIDRMRQQAMTALIGSIALCAPLFPTILLAEATTPVSTEPQQTSASFGDWVVRCDRAGGAAGKRVCEAAQSLVVKGQQGPIAQIAFARASDAGGMLLTVLLPVSISFGRPPSLGATDDDATTMTFRRCVPGGCLADAKVDSTLLKDLRSAQKPGKLMFTDAAERPLALPVSFRGLPQALDDLAKEARN